MGQETPSFLDGDASFLRGGLFDMMGRSQDALGLLSLQYFTKIWISISGKKKQNIRLVCYYKDTICWSGTVRCLPIWDLIHVKRNNHRRCVCKKLWMKGFQQCTIPKNGNTISLNQTWRSPFKTPLDFGKQTKKCPFVEKTAVVSDCFTAQSD